MIKVETKLFPILDAIEVGEVVNKDSICMSVHNTNDYFKMRSLDVYITKWRKLNSTKELKGDWRGNLKRIK